MKKLAATALLAAVMLCEFGTASAEPHMLTADPNKLPCVAGGPTADDAARAAAISPLVRNKMVGHVDAYSISCARQIVQTVQNRGLNQKAAAIALSTSIVESYNFNYDGGDLDSVGLFQQRDSWGSFAQRTDPVWATNKFLDVMQQFYPNGSWNNAAIGDVAADVQRPAENLRFRYAVEANDAITMTNALWNGGTEAEAPSVVVEANGAMQVFARDKGTGKLSTTWQSAAGSNWSGWKLLDTTAVGTPSAHVDNLGQMNVFTRRGDGHLIHLWQDGPNGAINKGADLGGDFAGDPVVITKADQTKVVFLRGTDGRLWHKWQTTPGGAFSTSALVRSDLGAVTGKPSVLVDAAGAFTLFVTRADGHLITAWQNTSGGAFTWADLGGDFAGDPVAVKKADGTQVVFVRGTDGRLWHKWQSTPGGSFSASALVKSDFGQIQGAPAVTLSGDLLQVFARRTDSHMITAWQSVAGGTFTSDDIGGDLAADPVIGTLPSGAKAAYARFADGSVMTTWQEVPGGPIRKTWSFLNS